jgi:hypothetical protein
MVLFLQSNKIALLLNGLAMSGNGRVECTASFGRRFKAPIPGWVAGLGSI